MCCFRWFCTHRNKEKEKSKEKGSFVSYPRKLSFSFSWHVARQVPKLTLLRRWSFTIGGSPHRVRCVKVWKSLLLTLSLCFILAGSVCLYYAFYFFKLTPLFSLARHNKTLIESMPLRRFRCLLIPAKFMCVTTKKKNPATHDPSLLITFSFRNNKLPAYLDWQSIREQGEKKNWIAYEELVYN